MSHINAEDVEKYLSDNPEFLSSRHELLLRLQLAAPPGQAIPLIERQAEMLKQRNIELRDRLQTLVTTARDNDILFEKTRNLVLAMLESRTVIELVETMEQRLHHDFNVDFFSFVSFNPAIIGPNFLTIDADQAILSLGNLATSRNAICGELRSKELHTLFGDKAVRVKSAAAQPFQLKQQRGLLVLGSKDPDRYRSTMGTLFLAYVGDVTARILQYLQADERN